VYLKRRLQKDHALIGAIKAQGAEVDTVLPYTYDAQAADANIMSAIDEMAAGRIDAIALTNLGQIRRLIEVARSRLRGPVTRRARTDADRVRRTGGIRRTQVPRPAHRYLSGRGRLLHAAADLGDGGVACQEPTARGFQLLIGKQRTIDVAAESERKNELLTRRTHRPIVERSLNAMSNRSRLLSQRLKLPACSTSRHPKRCR
jgi:hypothetical protein